MELASAAVAAMQQHRQLDARAAEAGGVLLGRLIKDSMDVVVDQVSLPSSADKRSRFRFFRAVTGPNRLVRLLTVTEIMQPASGQRAHP